jgi:hypothetical protein
MEEKDKRKVRQSCEKVCLICLNNEGYVLFIQDTQILRIFLLEISLIIKFGYEKLKGE